MIRAFVGLGSNYRPSASISAAIRQLEICFGSLLVSPRYTSPSHTGNGAAYTNLVVAFDTAKTASEVYGELKVIESAQGRERSESTRCLIDLDLLLYGDSVEAHQHFRLPREDILCFDFVLRPLTDLAPTLRHPENGQTYAELWTQMSAAGSALRAI